MKQVIQVIQERFLCALDSPPTMNHIVGMRKEIGHKNMCKLKVGLLMLHFNMCKWIQAAFLHPQICAHQHHHLELPTRGSWRSSSSSTFRLGRGRNAVGTPEERQ